MRLRLKKKKKKALKEFPHRIWGTAPGLVWHIFSRHCDHRSLGHCRALLASDILVRPTLSRLYRSTHHPGVFRQKKLKKLHGAPGLLGRDPPTEGWLGGEMTSCTEREGLACAFPATNAQFSPRPGG